ncbi:MAG: hypothetical protein ACP5P4_12170 [Steroidobacteraceae bacterium]
MSGPRNRRAAAASARSRELIREAMLEHAQAHPLSRPLTALELRRLTGLHLRVRRIQQLVASLRIESEIRELLAEQLDREQAAAATAPAADPHAQ